MPSPKLMSRLTSALLAGAACLFLGSCRGAAVSQPGEKGGGTIAPSALHDAPLPNVRLTQTLPFQVRLGTPEENSILICKFLAGSGFTPAKRAVVQADDAEDRRRDPQQMIKADHRVEAILRRIQRSTPLLTSFLERLQIASHTPHPGQNVACGTTRGCPVLLWHSHRRLGSCARCRI